MNTIVNGGDLSSRFAFRVGGDTPRDVESATLSNGQVVIGDTATQARVGDFFRAIEGPLAFQEIPIVAVTTNGFTIATTTLPDVGDDFYVMRDVTQRTDESGAQTVVATSGPIQFVLDGVATEVEEDTAVPANSIPLPVKVVDGAGVIPDFATETTLQSVLAEVTDINTNTPAGGALTDTQLRATAVPVSGPLTDVELRATAVPVSGPLTDVELRAVPVPVSGTVSTGGLTDAELRATPVAVSGPLTDVELRATAVPVSLSAAIPAGTNNIGDVDVTALPVTFDAGAADATTQRVVVATDQAPLPFVAGGKTVGGTYRNNYASTPVTTGAWVQLAASVSATTEMEIFDSSGQTMELGIGAAASETRLILVFPGGNGRVPVALNGERLSIRAVSATASVGEIDINLYN